MSDSYSLTFTDSQNFFFIGMFLLVYVFSVIIIVTWNIPGERIIIFFLPFIMLTHTHK